MIQGVHLTWESMRSCQGQRRGIIAEVRSQCTKSWSELQVVWGFYCCRAHHWLFCPSLDCISAWTHVTMSVYCCRAQNWLFCPSLDCISAWTHVTMLAALAVHSGTIFTAHTSVTPGPSAQFLFGLIESCLPPSCFILWDAGKMPGFLKGNKDTICWASVLPLPTHVSQIT